MCYKAKRILLRNKMNFVLPLFLFCLSTFFFLSCHKLNFVFDEQYCLLVVDLNKALLKQRHFSYISPHPNPANLIKVYHQHTFILIRMYFKHTFIRIITHPCLRNDTKGNVSGGNDPIKDWENDTPPWWYIVSLCHRYEC